MSGKTSMRAMGLGLLAAAGSAVSAQREMRPTVLCRIVSVSRTGIQFQDGYARALVDIAESICKEATGEPQVFPIEESITAVALAQAQDVAKVVSECAGVGTATLLVDARRRAEARAAAVGTASATILATASECDLCETALQSLVVAVETLTVDAIAEVDLDAESTFNAEPLTVNAVEKSVETQVGKLLTSIAAELRTSAISQCSIDLNYSPSRSGGCDSLGTDDIITQIDATARAGQEVQALGCDGADSFQEVQFRLGEVAVAVAQTVSRAAAICEVPHPFSTAACAYDLTSSVINSIATAHVEIFAQGMAEAVGPECDCEVAPRLQSEVQVATIIAEAIASSLAHVCVEGETSALNEDFQILVEEKLSEVVADALAEVFIVTFADVEECALNLGIGADINFASAR